MGKKFVITEEMRMPIAIAIVKMASPSHNPFAAYYVCGENNDILFLEDWEEIPSPDQAIRADHLLWLHPHIPELYHFSVVECAPLALDKVCGKTIVVYDDIWKEGYSKALSMALGYIPEEYELPLDEKTIQFFAALEKIDREMIQVSTIRAGLDIDSRVDPDVRLCDYGLGLWGARKEIIRLYRRNELHRAYHVIGTVAKDMTRYQKYADHTALGWRQAALLVAAVLGEQAL